MIETTPHDSEVTVSPKDAEIDALKAELKALKSNYDKLYLEALKIEHERKGVIECVRIYASGGKAHVPEAKT